MMFLRLLFIFCLFSIVGWILEVLYRSINKKKFVNPGFMSGCVVPIYGFGAVILNIICLLFENINSNYKIILIFFISMILLSVLEYISGVILLKCFNLKLWDYSKLKYNYKGFICLEFSIIWGLFSLVYYYFCYPYINNLAYYFINNQLCIFFLGIYIGIFLIDLGVSINLLTRLNKYAKSMKNIIDVEKLKIDIRIHINKNRFLNAIYPYISTNRYVREKIKENNSEKNK